MCPTFAAWETYWGPDEAHRFLVSAPGVEPALLTATD